MISIIPSDVDISGLEELTCAATGTIRPIPAGEVEKFDLQALRLFLHKYGLYTMPTTELIDYLAGIIAGKSAIEIGAGLGVIGRSLGIPITDNKMQEWPSVKARYDAARQPTINYPPDIIELDAHDAVRRYKPQIVIGSYITHKWKPGMNSGNQFGVDNLKIARKVQAYYMIGNLNTHRGDPAMQYLDGIERHDFLHTRGDRETSVIFRWKRKI
jgi:hypothetical protein